MKIIDSKVCSNCILKMYVKNNVEIPKPHGNLYSNTMYITYNNIYKTNVWNKLSKLYYDLFGIEILNDIHLTSLVRCKEPSNVSVPMSSIQCYKFLIYELKKYPKKNIIFLTGQKSPYKLIKYLEQYYNVRVSYSPWVLIKGTNEIKEKFINNLKHMR